MKDSLDNVEITELYTAQEPEKKRRKENKPPMMPQQIVSNTPDDGMARKPKKKRKRERTRVKVTLVKEESNTRTNVSAKEDFGNLSLVLKNED